MLLPGLGKPDALTGETVRRTTGRLVRAAGRIGVESAAQTAAEGAALAACRFTELKAPVEKRPSVRVRVVDNLDSGERDAFGLGTMAGAAIARGEKLTRTLQ